MSKNKLQFECVDTGKWEAFSAVNDEGSSFEWRIQICGDGTFTAGDSDRELLGKTVSPFFGSFKEAEQWCQKHEDDMLNSMCQVRLVPQVQTPRQQLR